MQLFVSGNFVEKRVVASRNVGCFLRLQIWGPMQGVVTFERCIVVKNTYLAIFWVLTSISQWFSLSLRSYYKEFFSRNKCLLVHEQRMGSFVGLQIEAPFPTLRSVYRLILIKQ